MAQTINVWLAMRNDAQALIHTRLTWDVATQGPYLGSITDRQAKLFGYMADRENTQRLFRIDRVSNRNWFVWSVNFDLPGNVMQKVKDELDLLALAYPNHIKIVGAWFWDGRQVGTQFVYGEVTQDVQIDDPDVDPPMIEGVIDPDFVWPQITVQMTYTDVIGTSGTPTYPLHPRLLKFMPDDIDGNAATVPSDINLGLGQTPRRFS